ncbi:MAG: hypothetical protein LRY51_02550 [Geovibrio sp.]|nr:hypothetical protein [Geovibrio sp.]
MQNFREIYELAVKYNLITTVEDEDGLAAFFLLSRTEGDFSGFRAEVQPLPIRRLFKFLEAMKVALAD